MKGEVPAMRRPLLLAIDICLMFLLAACGSLPTITRTPPHPAPRQQTIQLSLLQGSHAGDWPVFGYDLGHTNYVDPAVHPPVVSGRKAWERKIGQVISSPVTGLGMVFVASAGGYLYALKQDSGAIVWRVPLGKYLSDTTPALEGQIIFVAAQGSIVEALDARTGQRYWTFQTNDVIQSPPLVVGQVALVATQTTLWALSATKGTVLWQFHRGVFGWPTTASPTVAGDTVYIGLGAMTRLWALNLLSGQARWFFEAKDRITSTALIAGSSVFVATWHGTIYALNRADGSVRWSYALNATRSQSVVDGIGGSMAWANKRLYVGDYRGSILCLDATKGKLLWRYATGAQVLATPIIASDRLYVGSGDGYFYALDVRTGRPIWRYHTGEIRSSAVLTSKWLYIGSLIGMIYALD